MKLSVECLARPGTCAEKRADSKFGVRRRRGEAQEPPGRQLSRSLNLLLFLSFCLSVPAFYLLPRAVRPALVTHVAMLLPLLFAPVASAAYTHYSLSVPQSVLLYYVRR